jgi:hypothetical protein
MYNVKPRLLPRRNELALLQRIMLPSTGERWATVLSGKLLHPGLQLWAEMSD